MFIPGPGCFKRNQHNQTWSRFKFIFFQLFLFIFFLNCFQFYSGNDSASPKKFNFTTGHVRPICVAESRHRCELRCRPGFTSYIVGGRNLFSNLTAPSQVYRGLTLQPSDPYTPLSSSIVVDDQSQWRDGSHLAILRNVKSHLCGIVDASQAFLPICDYYDYFVGKNREDVWFDNLV